MSKRPNRRMPSHKAIYDYWTEQDNELLGQEEPGCMACHSVVVDDIHPSRWGGLLDRAHIIDRADYGLDGPQNLMLLCKWCHSRQPSFQPESFSWQLLDEWFDSVAGERLRNLLTKCRRLTSELSLSDIPNPVVATFFDGWPDDKLDERFSWLPDWVPMAEWRLMEEAA